MDEDLSSFWYICLASDISSLKIILLEKKLPQPKSFNIVFKDASSYLC